MPGLPGIRASDQDLDTLFANDLDSQGCNPDGLIEILNRSQAIVGCLKPTHLRQIARHLHLPDSRVWGTASFYHLFHFDPPPQHSCLICTGTACFVKGAGPLLKQLQRDGVAQRFKQRGIELGTVRCIGTVIQPFGAIATPFGEDHRGQPRNPVSLRSALGVKRPLEVGLGELLPRIC